MSGGGVEVAWRIRLRNVTQCYAKHAYKHYFFVRAQKKQPLAAVCVLVDEVVRRMRLELTRPFGHYPLKVACIPISPPAQGLYAASEQAREKPPLSLRYRTKLCIVPETGLEPARG